MIVTSLTNKGTCYLGGLSNKIQGEVNLVSLASSWATRFASQEKCSTFKKNLEQLCVHMVAVLMNQVSTLHEVTLLRPKSHCLDCYYLCWPQHRFEPTYFHVVSHKMNI